MPAIVNATRITAANSGTIPATTGGNMLVVVFGGSNGAGSTGTCSTSGCTLGTTALGKIGEVDALAAQSASCCAAYMLAGIPDSVTTVTVTGTGLVSADSYLVVYEVSGMGPAPFVTTLATVNNAGGVTTWSTDIGTAPPTPAITQFLAAITAHGPNSGQPNTLTPAGSWTNQTQFSWGAPGGDTIAGAQITSGSAWHAAVQRHVHGFRLLHSPGSSYLAGVRPVRASAAASAWLASRSRAAWPARRHSVLHRTAG